MCNNRVVVDNKLVKQLTSWGASACSIGIISAGSGAVLFAWLSRHVTPRSALVTTLALFLGAAPLPYAKMMFSHALAVGLLLRPREYAGLTLNPAPTK
jgi:hypothetical protein